MIRHVWLLLALVKLDKEVHNTSVAWGFLAEKLSQTRSLQMKIHADHSSASCRERPRGIGQRSGSADPTS